MATYQRIPFAESGDRQVIPETTADTAVSLTTGWTTAYAEDPTTSGTARRLQRENFNGLFHTITTAIQQYQQEGVFDFITAAQNGGSAFPYARDALVRYESPPATTRVYRSLVDNNTELPTVTANWTPIDSGITANTLATLLGLILTDSDPVDLVDTGNALNIGAADPTTSLHMALDRNQIQAKADATTSSSLAVNALGGSVDIGPQSGSGDVDLYASGVRVFRAESAGNVSVWGDEDTDTDTRLIQYRQLNGTARAQMGHPGTSNFEIRNLVNSGLVQLFGNSAGGVAQTLLVGNPDGALDGHHAGVIAWQTRDDGLSIRGSVAPAIGGTQDSFLSIQNSDGTAVGFVGFVSSPVMELRSLNHGAAIVLRGEDAGGTLQTIFNGDPDGASTLYQAGSAVASTTTAAAGGLQVDNQQTGGGLERVLTESDADIIVFKSANQIVNNSVTLVADTHLTHTFNSTGLYAVDIVMRVQQNTSSADIRVAISGAAGDAIGSIGADSVSDGEIRNVTVAETAPPASSVVFQTTTVLFTVVTITAVIDIISAPDTITVYWAQGTATAAATTVRTGSYMRIRRLGDT